jgi:serine/threonine protein kinase
LVFGALFHLPNIDP